MRRSDSRKTVRRIKIGGYADFCMHARERERERERERKESKEKPLVRAIDSAQRNERNWEGREEARTRCFRALFSKLD